ncbi:MAG: 50S ribosomal protein L9 [Phycisphaerales bacterium]|jgi:large subunit ribosomal protein L9
MARPVELLLLRNVENLGIVGDIVKVRAGYARNYLLPHALAEHPTDAKIEALKEARAKALAEIAAQRQLREETIAKLTGISIKLVRSCNDQGVLYGSITQRDIADALVAAGYAVDMRAVRLAAPFRRIGSYTCMIQFEKELKADITIDVAADRTLESMEEQKKAEEAAEAAIQAAEAEDREEMAAKGRRKSKG